MSIMAEDFIRDLNLRVIVPPGRKLWNVSSAELNRPGIQFTGFYEYFPFERPQVVGKVEMTYLEMLEPAKRREVLKKYFSFSGMPCVVICRGMEPPIEMIEEARNAGVALLGSDILTTRFNLNAVNYLSKELAPSVTRHGVLVDVYGVGVLITGDSGVGKSEAALELIKRGHQLVADDVVDIRRVSENRLVGECPEMIRHYMEIRGIGLIDIRAMYGISAVTQSKSIDLVMHLEKWQEDKEYDRLGMEDDYISILGVQVPNQITPVRPGRNMAIIIEVAARNHSLKQSGYNAAKELGRRLNEMLYNNKHSSEDEQG